MHIAVALSGEGSGHATRMTALCRLLSTRHQVTVWCPRHTCALMAPRLPGCRFRELPWVKTVYCGNRVRLLETVRVNIGLFASSGRLVRTLAADLTQLGVDALVCDYEPFMSRAALRARLPSVHFNHQAVVDRHPAVRWDWLIAWLTNRVMMPRSDGRILSSFYNGDVGALLRPEIAGRHEEPADFVVVYARAGFGEY
ncbi:hypothetical protein FJY71_07530, partial [candidate division WOR-3 bacterium]|nr:hypothetical protein [candidate division WOR-3 bacterium]